MSGLLRSAFACFVLLWFLPALSFAQCATDDEVCLQATGSSVTPREQISDEEITTDTYTEEQAELVAQITRNLKRRRLTRPAGDNAFEQIQRLQSLHPSHDYSVNGTKYIARILMVLGRRAMRGGDPVLAEARLQQAVKFDPSVSRQDELRRGIATLQGRSAAASQSQSPVFADNEQQSDNLQPDASQSDNQKQDKPATEKPLVETVPFTGEVTTRTYNREQADLVAGITSDLKRRQLIEPVGNNAVEKIQQLKELHPAHDYSVNGMKYVARILMVLGRQALRNGDLELASRHMLKAIQFDPQVKRQDELKTAIADAARNRESEREARELSEQNGSFTTYLDSESTGSVQQEPVSDVELVVPVMVAIPAGSFLMGNDNAAPDERPAHNVVVGAFSMSKHEITVEQYQAFAVATGRLAPQYLPDQRNLPATNVSWQDAVAYAEWLSRKTRKLFRLPTESEWEYAARAGTKTRYFTGNTLSNAANCADCGGPWAGKSVAPVGSFEPNEFGLYDTHGNVWEWVQDCWTDSYDHRTESPVAVEFSGCEHRVLRGGSWFHDQSRATVSYRGNEKTHFRDNSVGFRVVYEGL